MMDVGQMLEYLNKCYMHYESNLNVLQWNIFINQSEVSAQYVLIHLFSVHAH